MAVYQVDQYYVAISTISATKEQLKEIKATLDEHDWGDHDFQDGQVVVDGFESTGDAGYCNQLIDFILGN